MKLKTLALLASIFSFLAAISGIGSGISLYFQTDYGLVVLLTTSPHWLMDLTVSAFFFAFYRNLK